MNYLKNIIQKNTKLTLWAIVAFTVLLLIAFMSSLNLLSTLFSPLSTVKTSAEAESFYSDKKAYAQLENADVYFIDYGVYTYKTRYGVKTSEEKLSEVFGFVNFEDGYVLTNMPKSYVDMDEASLGAVSATCKVRSLEDGEYYKKAYDEMISEIVDATGASREEVEARVPKICLEIKENGRQEDQILFTLEILGLLVCAFFLIRKIIILCDYKKSKLYRELSLLGDAEQIEDSINRNIDSNNCIYKSDYKSIALYGLILPDYTIARKGAELHIFKTADLLWAHVKVTKNKVNFITVSKSFSVMLYFRGAQKPFSINFRNQEQANALINRISETLPVICGYSDELKHSYKSNYMEFLQTADQYHVEFLNRKKQEEVQPEQA
jgi:hypothetical protein